MHPPRNCRGPDSTRCRPRDRGRHVPRAAAGRGHAVARRRGLRGPGGSPRARQGDDTTEPGTMSAGATLALVRAVRGIRCEEIPADALEVARHCLLDFLGAAPAGARLLDLDEARWLHAMGIAGTQAAGLKSAFGSMAKPLHAGRAAETGLLAALLARGGFTASPSVLEAPQGFAATHAGGEPTSAALERWTGRFLVRDTLFKYHAACYLTHAAIEAAGTLCRRHAVDPDRIRRVELRVDPSVLGVCNVAAPRTGLEGKFSLRATTAMALLGHDTADPGTFTDARMADPALVRLRDPVSVIPVPGTGPTRTTVIVEAEGGRCEAAADTGVPATDVGAQRERLTGKFLALAVPVLGRAGAEALAGAALGVHQLGEGAELLRLARAR